eukprot:8955483-Prorocentrum_lima.AAC.1
MAQPLYPHATMTSLLDLVGDAVPGNMVTAVLEGHPAIRRDWLWGADLPFTRALFDVGDVET